MMGSGTTRDVVEGLNRHKRAGIEFWGGDLREGFGLTRRELPGRFDFLWLHPPYWSIIIKVQHNCTSDRKQYGKLEDVPIRHEYCVVFRKPIAALPCGPSQASEPAPACLEEAILKDSSRAA